MVKSPCCAENHTKDTLSQGTTYSIDTVKMRSFSIFLKSSVCPHPLSYIRLCLLLSIPPLKLIEVDDPFDMHLGY